MKRYKLIREYPGYNFESELHINDLNIYLKQENTTLEIFNEFWQEVIEKDYEILSFKQNSKIEDLWEAVDTVGDKFARKSGQMFCTTPYTLERILNNPLYSIHSVKRLSDGKIFTVGDKITYGKNTKGEELEIESIKIQGDNLFMKYTSDTMYFNDWNCKNFQHYKKPLFTTEDGVDIFEGDKYFQIGCRFDNIECTAYDENNFDDKLIIFSTKEAAEEYSLMNKPCLSIKDVLSMNQWNLVETKTSTTKKLKELVKNKK